MRKLAIASFVYSLAGLAAGVFYREYTKVVKFEGSTALSFVHPHLLGLGALFFLVVLLLSRQFGIAEARGFKLFQGLYHAGLSITVAMLITRGLLDARAVPLSAGLDGMVSGIAGTGHILLAAGLVTFFAVLLKSMKKTERAVS